jgi:hypothetical protein
MTLSSIIIIKKLRVFGTKFWCIIHYDGAFFITQFIAGLRKEIQRAIRLHNPRTVDTTLSLAEKQEEMLQELNPYSSSKFKHDYRSFSRKSRFQGKGILAPSPDTGKQSDDKSKQKN